MAKINNSFIIEKVQKNKNYRRIISDIAKIDGVINYSIDKTKGILHLEYDSEKDVMDKVLKVVQKHEKNATLSKLEYKESYRKVLKLKGLDCGHCAQRIESIAKKTFDYTQLMVDFSTERFIIETTDKALVDNIIERVSDVAHIVDPKIIVMDVKTRKRDATEEKFQLKSWKIAIFALGIIFLLTAMIIYGFTSRESFWGLFKHSDEIPNVFVLIFLGLAYVAVGYQVLWQFFKNIIRCHFLDENFLMTIASIGAIITRHYIEAVIVMLLYQVGELLQEKAVNYSRKSISDLLMYEASTAHLKVNGEEIDVEIESVMPGDVIVVRNGDMIPLDGVILEGKTYLDTKALTGEALYRNVKVGDEVLSGSINLGNVVEIKVQKAYSDSTMTKILDMVENASASKAKTENFITKFSKWYTPLVVALAVLYIMISPFFKKFILGSTDSILELFFSGHGSIYHAMVFLVISCPCALVISIPLTYFGGIGVSSKNGILIKGSNYLEALNNVNTVVFDKTGTLTKGEFRVQKIVSATPDVKESEILSLAAYVEYNSNHPIGKSIVEEYGVNNIFPDIIQDFVQVPGYGVRAYINGSKVIVCNKRYLDENKIEVEFKEEIGLVLAVLKEKKYLGYIVIGDGIREEATEAIGELRDLGVRKIAILTGDAKGMVDIVANELKIDEAYCELLPNDKVEKLQELKGAIENKKEHIIYIGDGINDAPVISNADVGIAMGSSGSEGAIAIADVVIISDNLNKVPQAIKIAKKTKILVMENIFFSLSIKLLVLLLVMLDIEVNIWLAIFSDVGVTLLAILNSLRITKTKTKDKTKVQTKVQTKTIDEESVKKDEK